MAKKTHPKLKRRVPSPASSGSPPGCFATPKAKAMARHIFRKFDAGSDKCQRLAAKGGKYPDSETNLGGLCEMAFAEMIERALREANDQALPQGGAKKGNDEH